MLYMQQSFGFQTRKWGITMRTEEQHKVFVDELLQHTCHFISNLTVCCNST